MDLVLHIGAHRTGSTMVAQSLAATIDAYPDCGVVLWGPRHLRAIPGFQAAASKFNGDIEPVDKNAAVDLDELASHFTREIAKERDKGTRTLILSEENVMGTMRQNFLKGRFYGDVLRRLAGFDSLLPQSAVRIALGIRDYGKVWTSAFHYMTQMGREQPDKDVARYTMMNDRRGWPEIAAEIRTVWPQSELLMWRQERLAREATDICAQIMGLEPNQIVTQTGKVNARLKKTTKTAIFSDDDAKHLTHRYNRHIRRLKSSDNIRLIGEVAA